MAEHDVEFWYGLHGGTPFKIGGGSHEEMAALLPGDDDIAELADREPAGAMGSDTRAFMMAAARNAGAEAEATAALEHYDALVEGSREAFRQRIIGAVVDPIDE